MDKFVLLQNYFQLMAFNLVPLGISEDCLEKETKKIKKDLTTISINDLKKIIKKCEKKLLTTFKKTKKRKIKKRSKSKKSSKSKKK